MVSDGIIDLVEAGVITGRRKTFLPGKIVAGFLLVYPATWSDVLGFTLVALVILSQWLRRGEPDAAVGR